MAKIDLIALGGNSFFLSGIFAVGVYIQGRQAVLIDSGISKDGAKELDKILLQKNSRPVAIINTHCHGDHSGGNAFFQQKYPDIQIFSTEAERPFIEDPLLAPICFCAGAAPFEELLKCKPITPQQVSKVTHIITPYQDQKILICGQEFEIFTLPGHTRGMIAVKTPDDVLYCGDAVFGEATFNKYPILFYTFISDALHSFKKLKSLAEQMKFCVLYHGGMVSNLSDLIDNHEQRLLEIKFDVLSFLEKEPLSVEELTAMFMQKHQIPDDLISLTLTKASIQGFVSDLQREKNIEIRICQGRAFAHLVK